MQTLNFPPCTFRFKNSENKTVVFDDIRKKFVVLTPEEWVRQHVVRYFIEEKKYPRSLINVEKLLRVNGLSKRYDVVIFRPDGSVRILVECKAPEVRINQSTFDQIARYNMTLDAEYLMVTNGLNHYYCTLDNVNARYNFLAELPSYDALELAETKTGL